MIKMTHAVATAALLTMGMFGGTASADPAPRHGLRSGLAKVTLEDDRSRITVMGEGSQSAVPDVMRLNAGVEVRRATAGTAFADARAAAAKLTEALKTAGIQAKDLRTNELSLGPEYSTYPTVSGYRAAQGVEAVVRDITSADKVIDTVAGVGEEARLNGISFEVSDNRRLVRAARDAAFRDATARAAQYARLSGRRLGPVLTVAEEDASPPPIRFAGAALADKASISPGQQSISVHVRVVYELL
ncbi:SIMPL domain-containing protein [Streptosporangium sp. NBC_01756]|uniref:SIMPL domain-containing protein n=1 Tax=Streptosporangium sp. NBC_01756 TaxID=2975950 RepID=UPI002DD9549D|nr:SIMPL domain-containing protein [Streptosporangium sp. NBC_01756]WSC84887.1 SIMPL domain-containing protein [Streptosporangium sp. NBC_01756]